MFNSIFGEYTQIAGAYFGFYIATTILGLAFNTLFMLAIGYDCKARKNDKRTMWMVLCFFFPIIAGIVYACTRDKNIRPQTKICAICGANIDPSATFCPNCGNSSFYQPDAQDSEMLVKKSKTFFGFAVGVYVLSVILSIVMVFTITSTVIGDIENMPDDFDSIINFDSDFYEYSYHYGYDVDGKTVYYDREGKAYDNGDDVLYYDRNGNTYTYDDEDYVFESADGYEFASYNCYVDEEGYFVYDKIADKDMSKAQIRYYDSTENFVDVYADREGNFYYFADVVSWNSEGKMVDFDGLLIEYKADNTVQ